jgi:predicted metal-dependent phosphoesterase TrpH
MQIGIMLYAFSIKERTLTSLKINATLAADAAIDLHMHTTYSDGLWTAQQLIDYLVAEKYDLVAVTDHDRVDKVGEIQTLAAKKQLPVLSGVEMSTQWNGLMGDLLCYGFDPEQNELVAITEELVHLRLEITYEIYDNLIRRGYKFPRLEEIFAESNGKLTYPYQNAILLRRHGYAPDWSSAMLMVMEAGYRPIRVDMAKTVDALHRSGGVGLIAHPGRRERDFTFYYPELLDQLRRDVPIDGIEVYHPSHSQESVVAYQEYVNKHDLLMSTGSDSHSKPDRMPMKFRAALSRRLLERVGVSIK